MAHEVDFHPPREPFFVYGNNTTINLINLHLLFVAVHLELNYSYY